MRFYGLHGHRRGRCAYSPHCWHGVGSVINRAAHRMVQLTQFYLIYKEDYNMKDTIISAIKTTMSSNDKVKIIMDLDDLCEVVIDWRTLLTIMWDEAAHCEQVGAVFSGRRFLSLCAEAYSDLASAASKAKRAANA